MGYYQDLREIMGEHSYEGSDIVLNKERGIKQYISYMLARTNTMFEWEGLPDTIPSQILELYLQIFGYVGFVNIEEANTNASDLIVTPPGLYIFYGGLGGLRDIYYRPLKFIVANPRLSESINANILYDTGRSEFDSSQPECIVMRNDSQYMGLLPLYNRYAAQMVENDISIRSAQINSRAQIGIVASTSSDIESARKYFDNLESGKLGIIGESGLIDGIKSVNISTNKVNTIIQLIELQQYLKASWYNELGLNANFNMKREYLSSEEIAATTDMLLPLVDDMLNCRQLTADFVNEHFGTNITVTKNSAWFNKEQEVVNKLVEEAHLADLEPDSIIDNATNKEDSSDVSEASEESEESDG